MAFNKTTAQRKLTFSEIAREARIPLDEVELLVMKALAEKLVRGHIDQVWRSGGGLSGTKVATSTCEDFCSEDISNE